VSEGHTDLYITGSNSRLLSGELATYIAGRHVSIEVWPLSFGEYLTFDAAYSNRDISPGGIDHPSIPDFLLSDTY
jgi:uncharacterized protein